MQNTRNSVFEIIKSKINISYIKSFKQSKTKKITSFPSKQNKLIRFNSKIPEPPLIKTFSTLVNQENSQLSGLESQKSKEDNNSSKSSVFKPPKSEKEVLNESVKKKETKDYYLTYIKNKIYHKISKNYTSPYIPDYKEKQNYYQNKLEEENTYYNYYLICHLIENKKCNYNVRYQEYLRLYNKQEYLITYFSKNEIFIIMNYLLNFIYNKDIATIAKKRTNLLSNDNIKNMFNNLVDNNYIFTGTLEILKGIAVYYKHRKSLYQDSNKIISNLYNIKPVYNEKIKYMYAKDIPTSQIPNCIPKCYYLEKEVIHYIKDFFNKIRFLKVDKLSQDNQLNQIKAKSKKRRCSSGKLKVYNFLGNISLTKSKEKDDNEETKEYNENKGNNSFKRMKYDKNVYDIESLVKKIIIGYKKNQEHGNININNYNKKYTTKISRKILKQRSNRINSMKLFPIGNLKNKENIFRPSKLLNTKALKVNDLNKLEFKTSFKNIESTTNKNVFPNIKKIHGNNLILNKDNIQNKNKETYYKEFEEKENHLNFKKIFSLKDKTVKYNITRNKKYKKIIRFDGLRNNRKNIIKDNHNSIKKSSSNDSLFFYKIKSSSKFVTKANKNKYSINKYFSLKKWHAQLYNHSTKNISIPKKVIFQGTRKKAFTTFSGSSIEDKENNVWENNKIDTDIINVSVKTSFLLKKINDLETKKNESFSKSNTLKKLIKYPKIYFSNCN